MRSDVIREIRERFSDAPGVDVIADSLANTIEHVQTSAAEAIAGADELIRAALDANGDRAQLLPEQVAILSEFAGKIEALLRNFKAVEPYREFSPTISAELDRIFAETRDRLFALRLAMEPGASDAN